MNRSILITRPRLLALLVSHGYRPKEVINPYHPHMKAWEVPRTAATVALVDQFYSELRKGGRGE